jgi:hypothetical protein
VFASIISQLFQVLSKSQLSKTSASNIFCISTILSSRLYNQFSLLEFLSHKLKLDNISALGSILLFISENFSCNFELTIHLLFLKSSQGSKSDFNSLISHHRFNTLFLIESFIFSFCFSVNQINFVSIYLLYHFNSKFISKPKLSNSFCISEISFLFISK